MGIFKKRQQHKFCPVCGTPAKVQDAYCIKCGFSYQQRHRKKGIKWRNLIIAIILLAIIYFGLRYANNIPIVPRSIPDALNFTFG